MGVGPGCIRKVAECEPVSNISLWSLPQFLLAGFCLKLRLWLPSMTSQAFPASRCFLVDVFNQQHRRKQEHPYRSGATSLLFSQEFGYCVSSKKLIINYQETRLPVAYLSTLGVGIWGPELSGECGNLPRLQAAELTVASRSPW